MQEVIVALAAVAATVLGIGLYRAKRIKELTAPKKQVVFTAFAPQPVGPYSQAVKLGSTVYISGCIALDVVSNKLVGENAAEQARKVLENLKEVVKASGSSLDRVVKTTILLRDMSDFAAVNAVYAEYFPTAPPARATFAVAGLPLNALVEIEAIASI